MGRIVHDERGNAKVDWVAAPEDYQRPVLELEDEARARRQRVDGANPYDRQPLPDAAGKKSGARTDLRALSEWIKMMRELEARRQAEGAGQDQEPPAAPDPAAADLPRDPVAPRGPRR